MKSQLLLCAIALMSLIVQVDTATAQYVAPTSAEGDRLRPGGDVSESVLSPFSHLLESIQAPAARQLLGSATCPVLQYYDATAAQPTFTQNLPSAVWATRISLPSTAVSVCTVWTVDINFEITGTGSGPIDTMVFTMREVNPPYTQLFSTYFIARYGQNYGSVEISPTAAPPVNQYAIISPKRDVYVTLQVRGPSTHQAIFRYTTPALFTSPPRSMVFPTPTSVAPASSVIGNSADFVLAPSVCCNFPIPIELSLFEGSCDGERVALRWRTESEASNDHFEIQRSTRIDGPWETRGARAGAGSSSRSHAYEFSDELGAALRAPGAPPLLYYRLMQVDFDGSIHEYGPIRVTIADPSATGFRLHPNYPNPLVLSRNLGTTIRYEVPAEESLLITVHDALGRELSRLVDDVKPAGVYETTWFPSVGADGIRSGQYFVRMQSGDRVAVQRLTVVK